MNESINFFVSRDFFDEFIVEVPGIARNESYPLDAIDFGDYL